MTENGAQGGHLISLGLLYTDPKSRWLSSKHSKANGHSVAPLSSAGGAHRERPGHQYPAAGGTPFRRT